MKIIKKIVEKELETKDIVVYKNGETGLVIGDIIIGEKDFMTTEIYDKNLLSKDFTGDEYDIIAVLSTYSWGLGTNNLLSCAKTFWNYYKNGKKYSNIGSFKITWERDKE